MAATRQRAYCASMAVAKGGDSARAVTRRNLISDIALPAGLAAFAAVGTHFAAHGQHVYRPADAGAYALAVAAAGALAWRRRYPVQVMGVAPRAAEGATSRLLRSGHTGTWLVPGAYGWPTRARRCGVWTCLPGPYVQCRDGVAVAAVADAAAVMR